MKIPAVSICIPSYNYGRYMADAIESVLRQTCDNWELVIVDDLSSDDSVDVAQRFAAGDSRIKVHVNEQNLGMTMNWNRCMEYATGRYIKFLCGDDVLESECVEKMQSVLDEHPEVTLVTSARLYADENLQPLKLFSYAGSSAIYPGLEAINRCLFNGNYIGEPTAVMFRADAAVRGFNTRYRHLQDLEMWFHLLEKGDLAVIPEPLCRFRQHEAQGTKNNVKSLAFLDDENKLYNDFIGKPYISSNSWNRRCWRFRVAYAIWNYRRYLDPAYYHQAVSRYWNPFLFRLCLPFWLALRKLVKIISYRNWRG